MTYIDRFHSSNGAYHAYNRLTEARRQLEHSFPDDDRRAIPQLVDAFAKIDEALDAVARLGKIFGGSGTHTLADFMPDESGLSANDRAMEERRKNSGLF